MVHDQLYKFFTDNGLFNSSQSGFRQGHSTTTCAFSVLNDIYKNFDKNSITGILFLDLRKAFDTVNHTMLLRKLEKYGVSQSANAWIRNYLTDRRQCTKYKSATSASSHIDIGVPQGSILGPLLFIIYLNDLPSMLRNCKVACYADDTAIYVSGETKVEVQHQLQEDFECISYWLKANKLSLNVGKTKVMCMATQYFRGDRNIYIHLDGIEIEQVDSYKYLGLIVDPKLTFCGHIDKLVKKSRQRIGAIAQVRKFIDKNLENFAVDISETLK